MTWIGEVRQTRDGVEEDVSSGIRDFETSLAFGGGVEFSAGRGALSIETRAILGFRNLSLVDPRELQLNAPLTIHSRAIVVLAGYRFR